MRILCILMSPLVLLGASLETATAAANRGPDLQIPISHVPPLPGDTANETNKVGYRFDDFDSGSGEVGGGAPAGSPQSIFAAGAAVPGTEQAGIVKTDTEPADTEAVPKTDGAKAACREDEDTLCLQGGRFDVEVRWQISDGTGGTARAESLSETSGLFWFSDKDNYEILLKILNGCRVPGLEGYWVFYSATTDAELNVRVSDTFSGIVKEYTNSQGRLAEPVRDLTTFDICP